MRTGFMTREERLDKALKYWDAEELARITMEGGDDVE